MKLRIILFTLVTLIINTSYARTGARYLIITPDNFVQAVQPLANWKIKKGVTTIIAPLSITGSSASQIKVTILTDIILGISPLSTY
jgi:hypothetical protein